MRVDINYWHQQSWFLVAKDAIKTLNLKPNFIFKTKIQATTQKNVTFKT